MLRSSYRRFTLGRTIREAVKRGFIELDEGVTFAPSLELKLDGGQFPQLRVGRNSHLDGRIVVRGGGFIGIGSYCSFRSATYLGSVARIDIGSNLVGAAGVFIVDNNNHPLDPGLRREMTLAPMGHPLWQWTAEGVESAPIFIGDNVWLGRGCSVLKGARIGSGSIVALGAVVTKGGPENAILAGNPACVVKTIPVSRDKSLGL